MTDILPLEFQPSFLEKSMFSIKGGDSENTSKEYREDVHEFRGGYPIQFSDNIHGGGSGDSKNKMVEGLSKIKHLSVPLGLVVNNYKNGGIKYIEPTELIQSIQDKKFNEIFELTQYRKKNTTKKNNKKITNKRKTIRKKN
jgi:hypothetical protein